MSEEKTILLSVKLDTTDLKKNAEIAEKNVAKLKEEQKKLLETTDKNSIEYKKLQFEIKQNEKVINDFIKVTKISQNESAKQNNSLNDQAQQLAAMKTAYRSMSEEMRNSDAGKQLLADTERINESLKAAEKAYGDNQRNVGNYGTALADLKRELKALKGEMVTLDAGSEEYQQASEKAGILGDKIKEVNENVKASTGGTGFEKLSNNLSLVQDDLMNLDFAGVSEKMKQMAVISKGMTFSEVLGGLKNMGSALLSLGKAILMNPLFLIAGAVVGIVAALKLWSDSINEKAIKSQENHTNSILKNISAMQEQRKLSEKITELTIKQAELEGKSTEEIGKMRLKALDKSNKDDFKERMKYFDAIQSARKSYNLAEEEDDKKKYAEQIKDLQGNYKELLNNSKTYGLERKNLQLEINNQLIEETKANNEKLKNQETQNNAERLEIARKLKDLMLDNEDLKNENQSKIIEAHYKFLEDSANGNIQQLLRIQEEKNTKLNELDLEIYNDSLARQKESYKREIAEANGNGKIIAEIKEKNQLEIQRINIEFENKQKTRDQQQVKDKENFEKQKLESERKAKQEIGLINAELNLLKTKGTDQEKQAFLNYQNEKIKVLEENAKKEIEINNLVGAEAEKVNAQLLLDTKKIQSEELKTKEETKDKETEIVLTKEQEKLQKQTVLAINSAVQLTDSLSQITQNRIERELQDEQNKYNDQADLLKSQLDANLISEAEYNAQKSTIDAEFKARERELKTEAFKKEKQANILKAIMNTAVGVAGALPNIPLSILAGVLGGVQVGLISSQPIPQFAKGGIFGGKSHSNGGTKGYFEDGTQIEVEKDESFFILNKRATPLISQLSNINQSTGGVPLMANGGMVKFANGGMVANSISGNLDQQFNQQNQLINLVSALPKPVVVVQDINDAQGNLINIENRANF
jgi:hypothetical protein